MQINSNYLFLKTLFVFFSGALLSCSAEKVITSDNFEKDSLNQIWTSDKFIEGGFEIQSEETRSGENAAMLQVKQGDQIEEEKGTHFERAELKESKKLMSAEYKNYSYKFSLMIPEGFPETGTRLVVAQWKQNCRSGNCDPDNPVIAVRFESGELFITLQTNEIRQELYRTKNSVLNVWLDFRFDVRFSRKDDGALFVWLNNQQIIRFTGVTAYAEQFGYPNPGEFYFKTGLYRDTMKEPMKIYFDDYSKSSLKNLHK
jgi:hypothetical protein